MSVGRWRERRLSLVVAGLALLTATPAVLLAANVTNPWVVAGATALAAGVAGSAAVWQERLRRSTLRRDDLEHGVVNGCLVLDGRLPKVRAVQNATWLGVHASPAVPDAGGSASVPLYVPRDIDGELRGLLGSSAFVLLVGDSLAGKSRAAYEAMREVLPDHTLIAPHGRDALPHAIRAATAQRRCVLWLNDLDVFLGPGGLTRPGVAAVLGGGQSHRVILATLRAVEATRLANAGPAADERQRQARREAQEALEQAHTIRMDRLFTSGERTRAQAHTADPRISDALNAAADFGLAEYLAAGPELLSEWENAWSPNTEPDVPSHPRAAALIEAAVDLRCAGYLSAAPRALVEHIHVRNLDEHGGVRLRPEPLPSAWEWATRPRQVTTSLLQADGEDQVHVFDYLVDVVQRRRPPDHHVPEDVVREALDWCPAADADSIAGVAQRQGRYGLAELAWRRAYELRARQVGVDHVDTVMAHGRLAGGLRDVGRRAEAETAFREVLAASTRTLGISHPHTLLARSELAFLLLDAGQITEAENELRDVLHECVRNLGAEHEHTLLTRTNLALLLLATRRPREAEAELVEVVALRTRLAGENHPNTLTARHLLAGARRMVIEAHGTEPGRDSAALEAEFRDVLDARMRLLGANHPDTRATREALDLLLEPLPTFNVVALGSRGVGKTLLLAAMFHQLSGGDAVEGLHLKARPHEAAYLGRKFGEMADPGADWPVGTAISEMKAFTFDFAWRLGYLEQPVFAISYVDYAGGLLDSADLPGLSWVEDLHRAIAKADAIVGLIDGVRLLRYLRGDPDSLVALNNTIRHIASVMMQSSSLVHFVITKWDLFDTFGGAGIDEAERLAIVRDVLMGLPLMRGLARSRPHVEIRLIPVSAVGRDFVEADENLLMSKRPGGRIAPLNVEVPFGVIVPDLFTAAQHAVSSQLPSRFVAPPPAVRHGFLATVTAVVSRAVARVPRQRGGSYEVDLRLFGNGPSRAALLSTLRKMTADFEERLPTAKLTEDTTPDPRA